MMPFPCCNYPRPAAIRMMRMPALFSRFPSLISRFLSQVALLSRRRLSKGAGPCSDPSKCAGGACERNIEVLSLAVQRNDAKAQQCPRSRSSGGACSLSHAPVVSSERSVLVQDSEQDAHHEHRHPLRRCRYGASVSTHKPPAPAQKRTDARQAAAAVPFLWAAPAPSPAQTCPPGRPAL